MRFPCHNHGNRLAIPSWRSKFLLAAIVALWTSSTATVSLAAAGDPSWQRKSSATGDLPAPNPGSQQTCCVVADLDGDGLDDFVVGERTQAPSIVWYKYNGKGWDKRVIDDTRLKPEAGGVCFDVDGDGHADIFIGEMGSPGAADNAKTYIWYGDGKGRFRKTVASHGQGIHEGLLSDLDGDGDLDVLMKPYNHNSPRIDILLNSPR